MYKIQTRKTDSLQHMIIGSDELVETLQHSHKNGVVKTVLKGDYILNGKLIPQGKTIYIPPNKKYSSVMKPGTLTEQCYSESCKQNDGVELITNKLYNAKDINSESATEASSAEALENYALSIGAEVLT